MKWCVKTKFKQMAKKKRLFCAGELRKKCLLLIISKKTVCRSWESKMFDHKENHCPPRYQMVRPYESKLGAKKLC